MNSQQKEVVDLATQNVGAQQEALDRAIARACVGLDDATAVQLRRSSERSRLALAHLAGLLRSAEFKGQDIVTIGGGVPVPVLPKEQAEALLESLSQVISGLEKDVLVPLERLALAEPELRAVKKQMGQVWGWIICDLQDPIWCKYPELRPMG